MYLTLAALFINLCSLYWTMWAVLTISLFMLTITDFMFFEVCQRLAAILHRGACNTQTLTGTTRALQDAEFW